MQTPQQHRRALLALDDVQLEQFVRAWVGKKTGYFSVELLSGPGDKGRDVVGFVTSNLHEAEWHNYQCKQFGGTLPTNQALADIGKIFYYAQQNSFTVPALQYFVAPRGLNRNLQHLFLNPTEFRLRFLQEWDKHCRNNISESFEVLLTPELRAFIETYDFSNIRHVSIDTLLADSAAKPVLYQWFGIDPGPAPAGVVPVGITGEELMYVSQLVDAYSERDKCIYASYEDIKNSATHWPHLCRQRERFFDADAFNRFFRDNTSAEETRVLQQEVRHGVDDVYGAQHADSLERVTAVLTQAANLNASGVLGKHARVSVKQGLCHHFVNDGDLRWKK